ncbi:MAG: UDP-N-acetylglucosamine 2-epimerase (non-hydrolyzing) [Muribaculaceae bacterium]|nr:UDP-N-acetylglucosamine 2-epimerase (non-hydrolyzing) [Muribaculaceae bacterium]
MFKKVTIIAGARPNFVKIAPIIHAIQADGSMTYRLVHTGQHYDQKMSGSFFEELRIPQPDVNLGCGGGTQAEQTAAIMTAFERDLLANPTDLVLVVGDVTSTMACAIVAKKLCVPVAHVEAGIRSHDLTMPEEINRMVTDSITDYFFTTSELAGENLRHAGISDDRIFFVGNVMIDTLTANLPRLQKPACVDELGLEDGKYIVLTLHRPANVDESERLRATMQAIVDGSHGLPIVFPIHPRTAKIFRDLGISAPNLHIVDPLGYLEFNWLVKHSMAVVTDSGGITEETTVMHVPCLTLRDNTERPETCTIGTNRLVGTDPAAIAPALADLFAGRWPEGNIPPLWDGQTSPRIISILRTL